MVSRILFDACMQANLVFPASAIQVKASDDGSNEAALVETTTSAHVVRMRCASCYSPVAATLGKKAMVVPAALFNKGTLPVDWRPQHHIYYEQRVLDMPDGLPKYERHFGGQLVDEDSVGKSAAD